MSFIATLFQCKLRRAGLLLSGVAVLGNLAGCTYTLVPLPPAGPGPFGRTIFIGDSLTAGFGDGTLLDTIQAHSWPALLAQQANFPVTQPLIGAPGAPGVLTLVSVGPPAVVVQTPGTTTGRDQPGVEPSNLSVPGHRLHDLMYMQPTTTPSTAIDALTDLVLGVPFETRQSQLGKTIADQPTSIFLWIGNNDALQADESGKPALMTPLNDFATDFAQLMRTLKTKTNARLVVANIPDVTAIPYMTQAYAMLKEAANATGKNASEIGSELGISRGDLLTSQGVSRVTAQIAAVQKGGAFSRLGDADVLDASEIVLTQNKVNSYNQIIQQQTAAVGGTLVDLHAAYGSFSSGISINGHWATNAFLGGLFSLDGVHPTQTGYALLANEYIKATNAAFNLNTPLVDVNRVAARDPNFGINAQHVASKVRIPAQAASQTSELLRGTRVE